MYAPTQEIRFAFRQVSKAPAFSVTVGLTLALIIGANRSSSRNRRETT
jgi:hypothetical protein